MEKKSNKVDFQIYHYHSIKIRKLGERIKKIAYEDSKHSTKPMGDLLSKFSNIWIIAPLVKLIK